MSLNSSRRVRVGTRSGAYAGRTSDIISTEALVLARKHSPRNSARNSTGHRKWCAYGKEVTGFAAAAAAYMKAGGDNRFMAPLIKHFGPTPLTDISQVVIDNAAAEIYPEAKPATRNRQVYTPMVAVLRRAGIERRFKRPLGWKSPKGVSWLEPAQAFAVLAAADAIDAEFGLFLRLLCYTGMRLGEALSVGSPRST